MLKKFFEENKNKDIVLNFYNEERKRIQKIIEKQRKYEQNKIKRNTEFEALSLI
ncbi:MAG: hypothetical protein LBQ24_04570 [Candidatus Peribacteria bacterium]|nr:hypothetical protein [Candidatus Peribacteria bacterium]